MKQPVTTWDLYYISYDEPQKEELWANLQQLAPWAKRVDGVKGFDTAHKTCANDSETDRFITVDGDNLVDPVFFDLELEIPDRLKDATLSWGARNSINGLCYGNGGLKLWTREFVLNMKTHENATRAEEKVDFCWDDRYVQLNGVYSETLPNGSPFQAFRAGFREGVKMTLDRGTKAGDGTIAKYLHDKNYRRLLIWASIGADVENGLWAIYGTRLGIYSANIDSNFDISKIADYDWFRTYFNEEVAPALVGDGAERCRRTGLKWDHQLLQAASTRLLSPLYKDLGLKIADVNPQQSEFFKATYEPPRRTSNPIVTEMEADRA